MEKDKEITVVIFRVFRDIKENYNAGGKLIALFPEIPHDYQGYQCESYMFVGEHGGADYHAVITRTRPAKPEEYEKMHNFLERVYGYNLKVYNKASWKMHQTCRDWARKYREQLKEKNNEKEKA